jgi:hypothetical protein
MEFVIGDKGDNNMDLWGYHRVNLFLCVAWAGVGAGGRADNEGGGQRERVR